MTSALLRKIPFFAALYLLASLAIFASIDPMPGDPVALRFGKLADPERVAIERERLGLDRSWLERYFRSQAQFLKGDWGRSLSSGRETLEDVRLFMPATIELSVCAMALGSCVGLGVALGASLGTRPWLSRLAQGIASIGLVVPIFWIGILLLIVGSLWLGWFPMGGRFDLMRLRSEGGTGFLLLDSVVSGNVEQLAMAIRYLTLPTICLATLPAASVASVAYSRLREPELIALIVALRSRGFRPARIVWRHLLRITAGPVVTVIGTSFGILLGGAFLTETVFSWPGIGRYLVSAILARDVFVAQNLLTFLVLLVVLVALLSDIIVWRLDPHRGGGRGE